MLVGVSSLGEIELSVGANGLEIMLPGATRPFETHFPHAVDVNASEKAKFSRKTGRLKLTLGLAQGDADG